MRLKSKLFNSQSNVGSKWGKLRFDDHGFLVSPELDEDVIRLLGSLESYEIVDDEAKSKKPEIEDGGKGDTQEEDATETFLKHVGGGYYELPNGEKVRGKKNALKLLEKLSD